MAILHKFIQAEFGDNFQTQNAILEVTPYKPEVMIVGTFNPSTPNANFADFFYGRNFFWPAIKNIFSDNPEIIHRRRMPTNGAPRDPVNPSLNEILNICEKLKLTFSDLVLKVLHTPNLHYQILKNDNIILNQVEYNLIQDGMKKGISGLEQLSTIGQLFWNTSNIINYLCINPQIKSLYFTRKPTGIWATQWSLIVNHSCMKGRRITNIFTPSGAGSPVNRKMTNLMNHWIYNNTPGFGNLDNIWLKENNARLSFP